MLVETAESTLSARAQATTGMLTLWFDASKKERPIYWIELTQALRSAAGPAIRTIDLEEVSRDYNIAGRQGAPLAHC